MNEGTKLSIDVFKTLFRYMVIAYCLKIGVTDNAVVEAYVGLAGAAATVLWGLYDSNYFHRLIDWLKAKTAE